MRGPWYISVAAVRDYLWLTRQKDTTDGPAFVRAENELIEMAEATVASGRKSRPCESGAAKYKGPKPRRLALIVGPGEGDRPALVAVRVWHDDGRGSAPHRK